MWTLCTRIPAVERLVFPGRLRLNISRSRCDPLRSPRCEQKSAKKWKDRPKKALNKCWISEGNAKSERKVAKTINNEIVFLLSNMPLEAAAASGYSEKKNC